MSTYIDLTTMSVETEARLDRLYAEAMESLAIRLEEQCEHLMGRRLIEAQREIREARKSAEAYWSRAAHFSEIEMISEAEDAFDEPTLISEVGWSDITDISGRALMWREEE
jgi:hypothetical protein